MEILYEFNTKRKIGDRTHPSLLVLNEGKWEFSKLVNREMLLKPYLSDNLNEAFNPCRYSFMRGQIRRQVKNDVMLGLNVKDSLNKLFKKNLKKPAVGMEKTMAIGCLRTMP